MVPISDWQLALSILLVLAAGGISAALRLGLLRSLVWGTVRTFVQLGIIGYVLEYVFRVNHPLLVLFLLLIMTLVASRTAAGRVPFRAELSFVALLASSLLVGFWVVVVIISPSPWY